MSTFWSGFIIVLVAAHLVGYAWLLKATAKMPEGTKVGETTGHVYDEDLEEYNNPLPRWWLIMFYLTIVFSIGYLVLYPGLGNFPGTLGWSQVKEHDRAVAAAEADYSQFYRALAATPIPELAEDPVAMQTGQRLFANNCALCHGSDAGGVTGFPDLTDDDWLYGGQPEAIKASILNGRQGVMPPWGTALGDDGVKNVAAYVRSLSGQPAPAEQMAAGEPQYAAMCASCHGVDGTGNPALGAPNLTDSTWLYGGSQAAIEESIRDGRQGVMPAHKDLLGEERVHILAAYVYSLSADREDVPHAQ